MADNCAGCGHTAFFHGMNGCDWEVNRQYFDPRPRQVCPCPRFRGATADTDPAPAKPKHDHESWQLQESAKGGWYCAACGEHVDEGPTGR